MFRFVPFVLLAACAAEPELAARETDVSLQFSREHVTADIYHYQLVLPVGSGPNAGVRIHRVVRETAPFVPRKTNSAAMLLHGDFSTFTTNFGSGLAPYLAARNVDVWGVDRRWTLATDDVSDFAGMGVAQEVEDVRTALAFARATRGSSERMALVGFSHGAQLAYTYAAVEAARAVRHVDALVALDWYADFAPEDQSLRDDACFFSGIEYQLVAAGEIDSPNDFLITLPQDRDLMLAIMGQTYLNVPFAPFYHLVSPILDGDTVTGFRESAESAISAWLAASPPHQAMREAADFDALLCGENPPLSAPLSQIRVPLLYVGAAGGIGVNGVYTTTRVSSTDVTTRIVQRFDPSRRAEDFGHADLLFATDAPALVWQPITSWLLHH